MNHALTHRSVDLIAATDQPIDPGNVAVGLIVIALAVGAIILARSPKARAATGRSAARGAIGSARAIGRPLRAIGRRGRAGSIGAWGRSIVALEARSAKAATAGRHERARVWRGMADAMIGSSAVRCPRAGCGWSQDPPRVADVAAHLRTHQDPTAAPGETTPPAAPPPTPTPTPTITKPEAPTPTPTPQKGNNMKIAETIPGLALLLEHDYRDTAVTQSETGGQSAAAAADLADSLTASTDAMAGMDMPETTRAILAGAAEQARIAAEAAERYQAAMAAVIGAVAQARDGIRGQEAVAEQAQAAGGAMRKEAYSG